MDATVDCKLISMDKWRQMKQVTERAGNFFLRFMGLGHDGCKARVLQCLQAGSCPAFGLVRGRIR
jgi:hypothetical protein